MLERLSVNNFALIQSLELEFHGELNVFTGETGAGKTILIDALSIALGERFDPASTTDKTKNSVIEVVFSIESPFLRKHEEIAAWMDESDEQLIIRREITPDGKNKCLVNTKSVNVSTLKQIGKHLMDFHGQHDHQQLLDPALHLSLIDRLAHVESELAVYRATFSEFSDLKKKRDELLELQAGREREMDLLKYQIDEIERIRPEPNEDVTLKEEHIRIANVEKLDEICSRILENLSDDERSALSRIGHSTKDLNSLVKIDESLKELPSQLSEAEILLSELARTLEDYKNDLSFDENRLKEIEDRLSDLDTLKRKYGGSVANAIEFLNSAKARYDILINFDETHADYEKQIKKFEKELQIQGNLISEKRKKVARKLKSAIETELADLGIPKAVFECRIEPTSPNENGVDEIEFFISMNPGSPALPLAKIISGGEASRVMLAMKRALIDTDQIPTMVFDEIDANIGGRLGTVVGEKLAEIAKKHQILLITHLPQIASFGNRHFRVLKRIEGKQTVTEYEVIDGEERIKELSQMFSGENESKVSREHARELLKSQHSR